MLRIDISTLSRPELQSLLATARRRGQAELADQIQAALAAPGADAAPRPMAPGFDDDEPGPMMLGPDPLPLPLELAGAPRPPRRRRPVALAAAVLVLSAGAIAAWGLGGASGWPGRPAPAGPAAPPPASPPISPPPARAMALQAAPAAPPTPAPSTPASQSASAATAPPKVLADVQTPSAKALPAPSRRRDPCATPPTPADRLVCNDLALDFLDHQLRDAYGRALDAGADPAAIRTAQAEWRRRRDPISDPHQLAELYHQRIQALNAAAANAGEAPAPGG